MVGSENDRLQAMSQVGERCEVVGQGIGEQPLPLEGQIEPAIYPRELAGV